VLWLQPSLFGLIEPAARLPAWCTTSASPGWRWAVPAWFRVLQLWQGQDLFTGLVWLSKILTDPFHDIALYWKSPLALLRGERIDPDAARAPVAAAAAQKRRRSISRSRMPRRMLRLLSAGPSTTSRPRICAPAATKRCSTSSKSASL
jgi:hypothetical protein